MKKIINGKKYDITTAKKVGYASHGGRSDFSFYEETLYLKRTGEFFLYGSGNAASRYSKQIEQNTRSGGSKIIPLSYESAQKWAEENLSAEGYENIFGEVCEDEAKMSDYKTLWEELEERVYQLSCKYESEGDTANDVSEQHSAYNKKEACDEILDLMSSLLNEN